MIKNFVNVRLMIDPYKGLNEWLNELDQKTKKVFFILIVVGFVLVLAVRRQFFLPEIKK